MRTQNYVPSYAYTLMEITTFTNAATTRHGMSNNDGVTTQTLNKL
jgi:hypothetical protein